MYRWSKVIESGKKVVCYGLLLCFVVGFDLTMGRCSCFGGCGCCGCIGCYGGCGCFLSLFILLLVIVWDDHPCGTVCDCLCH